MKTPMMSKAGNFVKCAVIGYPAAHSLSPLIHNYWIGRYHLQGRYEALDIPPAALAGQVKAMVEEGYAGFNVTVPHKQAIMDLCTQLSEQAQQIGAVNIVRIDSKGALHGDNSDAFGFLENLREQLPALALAGCPVLILGAGGAARAALYALLGAGAGPVYIANRTYDKAEKLAADFTQYGKVQAVDWDKRHEAAALVMLAVNTTSLGMAGQPPLPFDCEVLPPDAALYDIVYKPLETEFLKQGRQSGRPVVTGIGMLLHQARPAFKEWFGVMPVLDEMLRCEVTKKAQGVQE